MAAPATISTGKFKIYVESVDSPGEFIAPCGFNEKALNLSATTTEEVVDDCDDPDAASWTLRTIDALSAGISASGLLAKEHYAIWREWFLSAEGRNVRAVFEDADLGYYEGNAVLTALNHTGTRKQKVQAAVELGSNGEWAWVDGLPA